MITLLVLSLIDCIAVRMQKVVPVALILDRMYCAAICNINCCNIIWYRKQYLGWGSLMCYMYNLNATTEYVSQTVLFFL